jgi:hypothetical protein
VSAAYYDRDGHEIDLSEWAAKLSNNRIARTTIGDAEVSTVWVGLCHNNYRLVFETMIFGGPHGGEKTRYSSELDAIKGHIATVEALAAGYRPHWVAQ